MMIQTDPSLKDRSNEELLELFQKDKSLKIKQELTLRYLYIVQTIAVQMRGIYAGSFPVEDVINEGVIAVMKGIDRYDPAMESKFETFISQRIRGMIIDMVRKSDWMPRNFRKQNKDIEEARARLTGELKRQPTDAEVAAAVGIEEKKCKRIGQLSIMMNVLSLDMVVDDEDSGQKMQLTSSDADAEPEKAFLKGETRRMLAEAVKKLTEREQTVVSLYYVEELSMKHIAEVMQVSEPRVSQIHSNAIRKLRGFMQEGVRT